MRWEARRLLTEWKAHGKLIIALDFDDTIYPFNQDGEEHIDRYDSLVSLLVSCQVIGATIIINTASSQDRYPFILKYCKELGLDIHGINTNLPGLKYGNSGKVYANIYLDDRAGLSEATEMLEVALHHMTIRTN